MSDPAAGPAHEGLEIFELPDDPGEGVTAFADEPERRRAQWPGGVATAIALLMVVTWAVALAFALADVLELAVGLSYSAILLSGIALVAGIVAVVGDWGRGWGVAAIVIGVLLNPVVLLYALSWIGAL